MLRFRNPGTQYETHVRIIKLLYGYVKEQKFFDLDDMAKAITQEKLMTAYGHSGDAALALSNTKEKSKNSTAMNVKMYAEIFRMFGWIAPYDEKKSYPLVFTYLGAHIALSEGDCLKRLYEQSVLGINTPNEFDEKMRYTEKTRFFKCILRTLIDLGGVMYKHELCLGPMSIDDEDDTAYSNMIQSITVLRGDKKRLDDAFAALCKGLNMAHDSVDNATRTPIGLMKNCGWIRDTKNKTLYGKSLTCIQITEYGRKTYEAIRVMCDIRLNSFGSYSGGVQAALIRLGTYSMFQRAGLDISKVNATITKDKALCADILKGKELLFSPFATLRREIVENALGEHFGTEGTLPASSLMNMPKSNRRTSAISKLKLTIPNAVDFGLLEQDDIDFIKKVNGSDVKNTPSAVLVETLFSEYKTAKKEVFYPLISTLFKILGFKCSFSRPGDNGARWDAIIDDPQRSIPIEIKSPTEEEHISIKAIQQALENKIILLSRRTHITSAETTSLAVGYCLPNDRSDVDSLIKAIKSTYGYKIGVLDFKSLLAAAISVLRDGKGFDKEKLYTLEGFASADI